MVVNELDAILEKECLKLYDAFHQLHELQYQLQIVFGELLGYLFSFAKDEEKKECN